MKCNVEGPVGDFSDGDDFWLNVSQPSLDAIWNNLEDDVYSELLENDVVLVIQPVRYKG